jgi:molybdenum cofactor cytidylyltransferase
MIAGIFLAAGESRRFGGDKLLAEIGGEPLVYFSLTQCVASRLGEIRAVVEPDSPVEREVTRLFGQEARVRVDRNEDPARGMMSSLKTGLRALEGPCDGAMILLADMPLVTAIMINGLIDAFEERPVIVIPECGGELRHPRLIPAGLFQEFLELDDDEKGTRVIDKHQEDIVRVPIGSEANYIDVDTPDDLDTLKQL